MEALGELLTVEKQAGGIESIIQDLHAILDIPEDETGALRLHHPSLRDFLLHRHRCTDLNFFVEAIEAHRLLTCQIQDLMIRYFEQDEWKNRTAISKLRDKVYNKRRCPLGMEYACRNWIRHLKRSGFNIPPKDGNARSFLDEHAINWAIMLTRWDDDPERIGHIYDLEQRFSMGIEPRLYDLLWGRPVGRWAFDHTVFSVYRSALPFVHYPWLYRVPKSASLASLHKTSNRRIL